jgi:hypothetical protein
MYNSGAKRLIGSGMELRVRYLRSYLGICLKKLRKELKKKIQLDNLVSAWDIDVVLLS